MSVSSKSFNEKFVQRFARFTDFRRCQFVANLRSLTLKGDDSGLLQNAHILRQICFGQSRARHQFSRELSSLSCEKMNNFQPFGVRQCFTDFGLRGEYSFIIIFHTRLENRHQNSKLRNSATKWDDFCVSINDDWRLYKRRAAVNKKGYIRPYRKPERGGQVERWAGKESLSYPDRGGVSPSSRARRFNRVREKTENALEMIKRKKIVFFERQRHLWQWTDVSILSAVRAVRRGVFLVEFLVVVRFESGFFNGFDDETFENFVVIIERVRPTGFGKLVIIGCGRSFV